MEILSKNGDFFRLFIINYQFPYIDNAHHDSNWLVIKIEASHQNRKWTAIDSCLLTYEVEELANWFENLAKGNNKKAKIEFLEQSLEFHLIDELSKQYLRIYFELELRPEWAPWNGFMEDLWLDFSILELDFNSLASSLRQQLKKYPQRPFRQCHSYE